MKKRIEIAKNTKRFSFIELFLPILADILQINSEADTKEVSNNAWNLVDDADEYDKVIEKIESSRKDPKQDQNIVYIK